MQTTALPRLADRLAALEPYVLADGTATFVPAVANPGRPALVNDARADRFIEARICQMCGFGMLPGEVALIHPRGPGRDLSRIRDKASESPPIHPDCARYVASMCPMMRRHGAIVVVCEAVQTRCDSYLTLVPAGVRRVIRIAGASAQGRKPPLSPSTPFPVGRRRASTEQTP